MSTENLGSLLSPQERLDLPSPGARARRWARMSPGEALRAAGDRLARAAERPWVRRGLAAGLGLVLAGGAFGAVVAMWPRAIPDFATGDIEDVLDYTLLSDDFNKLPIDKRLQLIKDLVARLKSMDAGDSEAMALFAAGITGKAREQLRTNAERLAVDLWDSYADKYDDIPMDQREQYLDDAFNEFTRLMEDIGGVENKKTDRERLSDAREQAQRDMKRARETDRPLEGARIGRLMKTMEERGGKVSSPRQQARMARFTRDMVRNLRGQDLNTGRPKGEAPTEQPGEPAETPPSGG